MTSPRLVNIPRVPVDAFAAMDMLLAVASELRECGWEVNLAIETGVVESVSFAASFPKPEAPE